MNKRFITGILLIMLAISGSLYSNANAQPPRGEDYERGPGGPEMRGPDRSLELMAEVLGLSAEQKSQIKTIMEKEHGTMGKFRQTMDAGRKAMDELAMSDNFDTAKAQALADDQAKKMSEMMVAKAKLQNQIFAVMTPEQRTLAKKIRPLLQLGPPMGPGGPPPAR